MTRAMMSREEVLEVLSTVPDPEVPAISVVDLGIIRDVVVNETEVRVTVTPTYSGCPAMREIEDDIRTALMNAGAPAVVDQHGVRTRMDNRLDDGRSA